jgi:hypothetical protein
MWRAIIDKERSNYDQWKLWLIEKKECREIGHMVSKELARKIREEIEQVGRENKKLREENERFGKIRDVLQQYNLEHMASWQSPELVVGKLLEKANMGMSEKIERAIESVCDATKRLKEMMDEEKKQMKLEIPEVKA